MCNWVLLSNNKLMDKIVLCPWKVGKLPKPSFCQIFSFCLFVCFYSRLIWRSHYYISCSMSTSGAGPSSSNRVQHQQGSNSSSGQTEANGNTTPSPPPQSSTNTAATATPPVKEAKEAKPNPKMSKALSTSAKRYVTCCSIPVWHFIFNFSFLLQNTERVGRNHTGSPSKLQACHKFAVIIQTIKI